MVSSSSSGAAGGGGSGGQGVVDNQNPQAGSHRLLPKKECDLFKNVVKHYEQKQYKKALKQADAILKKFPQHGETLCMKGLTLNYYHNAHGGQNNAQSSSQGGGGGSGGSNASSKRAEAVALVKRGLMQDMRSHVCWHVYGLLHRADRNYTEAIKAYKQALRIDPENLQILRDLSMLQIQMRDCDGFAVTRNSLLTLKPNAKINWMAFALARHLTGDLQGAVKVIDIYLGTLTEGSAELGRCFESSELALYKNRILAEMPDNYKQALDHLHVCEGIVVDRGAWLETRAFYQLQLGDFTAAKQSCWRMMHRGMTENHRVHSLYMCAVLEYRGDVVSEALDKCVGTQTLATLVPLSADEKRRLRETYEELRSCFPDSHAMVRIPITLLDDTSSGTELRAALDKICRKDLARGVPSLCAELQSHVRSVDPATNRYVRPSDPVDYKNHPTYLMLVDMADGYVRSLSSNPSKFDPSDPDDDELQQPPSTLLWAWFLRASLHELAAEYAEGLELADKCLEHTPTAVDVYELKARLLRGAGDVQAAVTCLDQGRDLDRQDRYMNNQTVQYMLWAGQDEKALQRISLFTRHEGNVEQNLFDMQCSWYELGAADCLARKQIWGRALKKYAAVLKHFDDFQEDQFDFHAYCLRKVTLRSYVAVLRFEDTVYGQEYYGRAAAGMIRIYLRLYDAPDSAFDATAEPDYSKMTAAERKKAKAQARKKKKAAERKQQQQQQQQGQDNKASAGGGGGGGAAGAGAKANNKSNQNNSGNTGNKGSGGGGGGGNAGNNNNNNNNSNNNATAAVDEDPLGKEYLQRDPLQEANKYACVLTRYAPNRQETWTLRYDVAVRRKKVVQALQALHKARAIDPDGPELFTRIVDFAMKVKDDYFVTGTDKKGESVGNDENKNNKPTSLSPAVAYVVEQETPVLLNNAPSLEDFVRAAVKRVQEATAADAASADSPPLDYRAAVARGLFRISTATGNKNNNNDNNFSSAKVTSEAANLIADCDLDHTRNVTVDTCRDALDALDYINGKNNCEEGAKQRWIHKVKTKFPLLQNFGGTG